MRGACESGNLELVEYAIAKGAKEMSQSLKTAAKYGTKEMLMKLIEKGAKMKEKTDDLVIASIQEKNLSTFQFFMEKNLHKLSTLENYRNFVFQKIISEKKNHCFEIFVHFCKICQKFLTHNDYQLFLKDCIDKNFFDAVFYIIKNVEMKFQKNFDFDKNKILVFPDHIISIAAKNGLDLNFRINSSTLTLLSHYIDNPKKLKFLLSLGLNPNLNNNTMRERLPKTNLSYAFCFQKEKSIK